MRFNLALRSVRVGARKSLPGQGLWQLTSWRSFASPATSECASNISSLLHSNPEQGAADLLAALPEATRQAVSAAVLKESLEAGDVDPQRSPRGPKDEQPDRIADYDLQMSELYNSVANESLAHKHCMGYNLKKAIGDVGGQACLEAACGNGAYMKYLYDEGATFVLGADLSAENLAVCRSNHTAAGVQASAMDYIQTDLGELQAYKGGPFDLAVMGCCICYCSNQEMLISWLRNMYSNLKPGGRLVCLNTRGALPEAEQEELNTKFDIDYLKEAEGGSKSFSPAFVRFPNGWQTDYIFLEANTIHEAMLETGFKVARVPMVADPEYQGDKDLARLVQLMPYDLFVASKPM